MSTIGGPGGIGGPKGPTGPTRADGPEAPDEMDRPDQVGAVEAATGSAPTANIDAIAAELAAGRLTPHEAVEKLVDQIAGTDALDPADRAELREMMTDLIAHDPHLGALVGRL